MFDGRALLPDRAQPRRHADSTGAELEGVHLPGEVRAQEQIGLCEAELRMSAVADVHRPKERLVAIARTARQFGAAGIDGDHDKIVCVTREIHRGEVGVCAVGEQPVTEFKGWQDTGECSAGIHRCVRGNVAEDHALTTAQIGGRHHDWNACLVERCVPDERT